MFSSREVYSYIDFLSEIGGLRELLTLIFKMLFMALYTPNMYLASIIKSMGPITRPGKQFNDKTLQKKIQMDSY